MNYDNSNVRRQDRLLDEERAIEMLKNCEWGVLSMADANGVPYGIPVNFVWDGNSSIYIHCAPEGKKLRIIDEQPQVSFCLIDSVHIKPEQLTTNYESVVLQGEAHFLTDDEEKLHGLTLLVEKLCSDCKEHAMKGVHGSFHRVGVIRVDFTTFSGKRKEVK